jgi:hypothetical protein
METRAVKKSPDKFLGHSCQLWHTHIICQWTKEGKFPALICQSYNQYMPYFQVFTLDFLLSWKYQTIYKRKKSTNPRKEREEHKESTNIQKPRQYPKVQGRNKKKKALTQIQTSSLGP